MPSRACALSLASLLAVLVLPGCNNTLNPLCSSARPAPVIGSLSPADVTFSEVQQGVTITVTGHQFVSSSQVVVNNTPIAATIVSPQKLTIKLSPAVVSGPGSVKIMVQTPSGNSGDLGSTTGGNTTVSLLPLN